MTGTKPAAEVRLVRRGRPRWQPTNEIRVWITDLAGRGITQNGIGQVSFVVELGPGEPEDALARRYANAVLRLAQ